MNPEKQKLDNLTIVRFFAAFAVFMLHGGMVFTNSSSTPEWMKNIIVHGGEGVTIFFVLSGFILAYNYRTKVTGDNFNFKSYLMNRFARVYPVYFVAMVIGIPFMILHAKNMGIHYNPAYLGADAVARFGLLHAWYPYFNSHPHWLTQGWTLSVEFLFYLAFPFLLRVIDSGKKDIIAIWLIGVTMSWLPRMLIMRQLGNDGIDIVQQFPLLRLPEFVVGICSFYIFDQIKSNRKMLTTMKIASVLGLLAIFSQAFSYGESPLCLLTVIASSAMIIGLAGETQVGEPSKLRKFFIFLGEASYSLYLMHGFVILLTFKGLERILHNNAETSYLAFGVALVVTIAVSGLCYRFVEEPARKWLRSRSKDRITSQTSVPDGLVADGETPVKKSA